MQFPNGMKLFLGEKPLLTFDRRNLSYKYGMPLWMQDDLEAKKSLT
jgi:hypothetical protein